MIAFSVLVHEKPEMAQVLVQNYRKFVPDCLVVIHINKVNREEFLAANIDWDVEGAIINPESHEVRHCEFGLVEGHLSNFEFIKSYDFSHFCLMASNVMFVKSGCESYMAKNKVGLRISAYVTDESKDNAGDNYPFYDNQLANLLDKNKWDKVVMCQFEGCFFEKTKFKIMADCLKDYFSVNRNIAYAREHYLFGTCFVNLWPNEPLSQHITTFFQHGGFPSIDVLEMMRDAVSPDNLFSFKRCPRDITHEIVHYLRNLEPTNPIIN